MSKLFELTAKLLSEGKRAGIWHRVSAVIAWLVVFSTTYTMILPAAVFDNVAAEVLEDAAEETSVGDLLMAPSEKASGRVLRRKIPGNFRSRMRVLFRRKQKPLRLLTAPRAATG